MTHLVVAKLPRAAGHTALVKKWKEAEIEKQWKESAWAKKREQKARRSELTDFERFKVMKLRKQVSSDSSDLMAQSRVELERGLT